MNREKVAAAASKKREPVRMYGSNSPVLPATQCTPSARTPALAVATTLLKLLYTLPPTVYSKMTTTVMMAHMAAPPTPS